MPLAAIKKELSDIRSQKFPSVVDFEGDVMKKPHEHFKDNAIYAVFLYKRYQTILDHSSKVGYDGFGPTFDQSKTSGDKVRLLLTNHESRQLLEELTDDLMDTNDFDIDVKSSDLCGQARLAGNKSFNRKEYDKALACYNEVSV